MRLREVADWHFADIKGLSVNMAQTGKNRKGDKVIDENLKRVYEEAMQEGVPDRFRELLDALKQQDEQKGSVK